MSVINSLLLIVQLYLPGDLAGDLAKNLPAGFSYQKNGEKIIFKAKPISAKGCLDRALLEIKREDNRLYRSVISYCSTSGDKKDSLSHWQVFVVKEEAEGPSAGTLSEVVSRLGDYIAVHRLSADKIFLTVFNAKTSSDVSQNNSTFYLTSKNSQRFQNVLHSAEAALLFFAQTKLFLIKPVPQEGSSQIDNVYHAELVTLEELPPFYYDQKKQVASNFLNSLFSNSLRTFEYSPLLQTVLLEFQFGSTRNFCLYDLQKQQWLLTSGGFLNAQLFDQFHNKNKNLIIHLKPTKEENKAVKKYFRVLLNGKQIAQSEFLNSRETLFMSMQIAEGSHLLQIERFVAYKEDDKYERDRNVLQYDGIRIDIEKKHKTLITSRPGKTDEAKADVLLNFVYNLESNGVDFKID